MITIQTNARRMLLTSNSVRRHRSSGDAITMAKPSVDFDLNASWRTMDAELSDRSGPSRTDSAREGGILKVRTQRDSLASDYGRPCPAGDASPPSSPGAPLPPVPERRRVRFGAVEFREYRRILCDNPSTTAGPPIGLGWSHDPDETVSLDLDLYESEREGCRRSKAELSMPPLVREDLLREVGYSRNEIRIAVKAARKEREARRAASRRHPRFDPLVEKVEAMRSGVRRLLPRIWSTGQLSQ